MLYFIHRAGEPSLVKMGYVGSETIENRLSEGATWCPEGFARIGVAPGTKHHDTENKRRWAALRWRRNGGGTEWEKRTPEFDEWMQIQIKKSPPLELRWIVDSLWQPVADC